MNVKVHLKDQAQGIEFENVINTYQKGSLYCVYVGSGLVYKFPIQDIFSITEDYGEHLREQE